ncbi:MAG: hypothetical protein ABI718_07410 [Acidobacteriota bacterium]
MVSAITTDVFLATALAVFMAIFPYATLKPSARGRYALVDALSYALLIGLALLIRPLGLDVPQSLYFPILLMTKVTLFVVVVALYGEDAVRWSPNHAALFAGAIFALMVPHVLTSPIDGDEPFYLMVTQSMVEDHDLDLSNQYRTIATSPTRRPDIRAQQGDPIGPHGEHYSRTEPFLSILLIPGFLLGGLAGAVLTMALFGALLVRSVMSLLEEEGISFRTSVIAFWFLAFGAPVVFYSTRIWPEVPAAFFFVEALRASRQRRGARLLFSLAGLVLLKLRFIAVAVVLLPLAVFRSGVSRKFLAASAILLVPIVIVWWISGSPFNVHSLRGEVLPAEWWKVGRGLFGLLLDGQAGLMLQAPILLLGVFSLARWREAPETVKLGVFSSLLYLFLLFPRDEWHGGWAPPLRYLVVFAPVLILSAAAAIDRMNRFAALLLLALWTCVITIHGVGFPWRLFHIATRENFVGEWLSLQTGADVSRMLPSFIRPNLAAIVAAVLFCVVFQACLVLGVMKIPRWYPGPFAVALFALALVLLYARGMRPGTLVDFEDAHVVHSGGELDPEQYTVARFLYRDGWRVRSGDVLTFRYAGGPSNIFYKSSEPISVSVDGRQSFLPGTGGRWRSAPLDIPRAAGRRELAVLTGSAVLDRLETR